MSLVPTLFCVCVFQTDRQIGGKVIDRQVDRQIASNHCFLMVFLYFYNCGTFVGRSASAKGKFGSGFAAHEEICF